MKPKLPNQFKAAEVNGVPFAIVLGEDELAQGKVKIKEMGLPDGHAEKEGVLVDISDLVLQVKERLARKNQLDNITRQAEGLKVVQGIKGEDVKPLVQPAATAPDAGSADPSAPAPVPAT